MWDQALPTHLSGGGFAPEELMVERAVGRAEAGLQEDTAVGDGLQWSRALVGEAKPYEELQNRGGTVVREGWVSQPRSPRKLGARLGLGHSQEASGAAESPEQLCASAIVESGHLVRSYQWPPPALKAMTLEGKRTRVPKLRRLQATPTADLKGPLIIHPKNIHSVPDLY